MDFGFEQKEESCQYPPLQFRQKKIEISQIHVHIEKNNYHEVYTMTKFRKLVFFNFVNLEEG